MPVGTNVKGKEKFDLKSLPPDGFVELKRMNYGDSVQRRAMMKLSFTSKSNSKDFQGEMAMASVDIQRFEFQQCIVDHNITDENEIKLNLTTVADMVRLDPQVGQEIEELIGKMNNFDADNKEGNSPAAAKPS